MDKVFIRDIIIHAEFESELYGMNYRDRYHWDALVV